MGVNTQSERAFAQREIEMQMDMIEKLMTEYKLEMKHDPETGDWIFNVSVSEKEKKS